MKSDTKYLRKKGQVYQFQYTVKDSLKHHPMFWGKKVYIKSLKTGDLHIARMRRDQILREIEQILEGSIASEFRSYVDQLRESNRQFLSLNPEFGEDGYGVILDSIENEARKKGVEFDQYQRLPNNLPDDLRFKVDALEYATKLDRNPDTQPLPPSAYQESLKDIAKRTVELKRQIGKREKTLGKYNRSVDVFLGHLGLKDIPIAVIRRKQVADFSMTAQAKYSGSSVANFLSFLSEIWKVARDLELVEGENPFIGHKIKDDKASYLPWSMDQLKDLYKLLPEEDKLAFKIGVYTGARIDEIITLQPEDIQEVQTDKGKVLCLHIKSKGDGKNKNATRLTPVHPALTKDLKDFQGFSCSSSVYSKRFGRVKRGYLGEKDTRRYCFHSIRHTLATSLHRAGVDELIISYITGHANPGRSEAARTYIHGPLMRQMQEALKKLPVII